MKVAVIGGGIAGLAAAWELRDRAEVTVFEPGRLGGKILTTDFCGHPVDEGPDAFITRTPEAVELCAEAGLTGELVAPAAGRSMLWWRGQLRPLPEGLVLGVPGRLGALVGAGILSPAGLARAGLDLVLPRRRPPSELSMWDLIADRFGPEVATRLVDPLVGGIHAGRTENLGALEVAPQIVGAAERSRSLALGLRNAPVAASGRPIFLTVRAGLAALVTALVERLRAGGVSFVSEGVGRLGVADMVPGRPGVALSTCAPTMASNGWRPGGDRRWVAPGVDAVTYDGAVLAAPAPAAATMLGGEAGAGLAGIPTASVVLVTMAFTGDAEVPPGVNGFLVPRSEDRLMTACSFASAKWPHWARPGQPLLRVSAGRHGDDRAIDSADETVVDRLLGEVQAALGWTAVPSAVRVSRWRDSFPQQLVGHLGRLAAIEKRLAEELPAVALAGASYRGSGIPACVASGRAAARQVLAGGRRREPLAPGPGAPLHGPPAFADPVIQGLGGGYDFSPPQIAQRVEARSVTPTCRPRRPCPSAAVVGGRRGRCG